MMTSARADEVPGAGSRHVLAAASSSSRVGGQEVQLGRAELGAEQERQAELGEGELLGQAGHLLGLELDPVAAELGGRGQRRRPRRRAASTPASAAAATGSVSSPGRSG